MRRPVAYRNQLPPGIARVAGRLINCSIHTETRDRDRVREGLHCQLKLQLRRQRSSVVLIRDVEIRYHTKYALLLLNFDLFNSHFLRSGGGHCRFDGRDAETYILHYEGLPWLEDDLVRTPILEIGSTDLDSNRCSSFNFLEAKETVIPCNEGSTFVRSLQNNM